MVRLDMGVAAGVEENSLLPHLLLLIVSMGIASATTAPPRS